MNNAEKLESEVEAQLAQAEYYAGHYDRAYGESGLVMRYRYLLGLVKIIREEAKKP